MSRNGVGDLVVDDPHHLLGRDAVGGQRGDQRAGAGADVDVELVDAAVDRQQVERAQRADLVDAAGEAAAAQHQRGARLRGARTAARPRAAPFSSLTTLPIRGGQSIERSSGAGRGSVWPVRTMIVLRLTQVADLDAAALDASPACRRSGPGRSSACRARSPRRCARWCGTSPCRRRTGAARASWSACASPRSRRAWRWQAFVNDEPVEAQLGDQLLGALLALPCGLRTWRMRKRPRKNWPVWTSCAWCRPRCGA